MQLIIRNRQINTLFESKGEILYRPFFVQLRKFLIDLGTKPTQATASKELQEYMHMDSKNIIEKLIDADILRRDSSIIETPKEVTANGKSKVAFEIRYSIPKKNFKQKVKSFFDKYVAN